jgi:hypothetical protein
VLFNAVERGYVVARVLRLPFLFWQQTRSDESPDLFSR